jgi:hypothetical protein
MSATGASVPFVGGVWVEGRTLAIGDVKGEGEQTHTTNLSSFSRMTDARTFRERIEGEKQRRQMREAKQVAAVMDGAPWLLERVELSRSDTVRMRGFPMRLNASPPFWKRSIRLVTPRLLMRFDAVCTCCNPVARPLCRVGSDSRPVRCVRWARSASISRSCTNAKQTCSLPALETPVGSLVQPWSKAPTRG